MKNTLLLVILLSFSFGKAQQSELLETTWYLTEVVHQNNSYPFVSNDEVSNVFLNFGTNTDFENPLINIHFCTSGEGEVLFENSNQDSSFRLINTVFLAWSCQTEDNYYYENMYLGIFDLPNVHTDGYYYGDFTYEIFGESENRTLIITNESGNQAVYNSQNTASVLDAKKFGLTIYPNPVSDILNFNLPDNYFYFNIKIFDAKGKLLLENSDVSSVNVSTLQNGMYFIFLENPDTFQKFTLKFIKK